MLIERIQTDIVTAMRARNELRLNTLRSIKTALDRFRVDQQKPVTEAVEVSILTTLAKQRKESADMFRKGSRPELAEKEEAELKVIESYMPEEASEAELDAAIQQATEDLTYAGRVLTPKDMGSVMKFVAATLQGKRIDGKVLSEKVKGRLANVPR